MVKPSFEERLINALMRIHSSIGGLSHTLEFMDERKRFPIVNPSEEIAKRIKEQKKEQFLEEQIEILHKQNNILMKTVIVAMVGILITASVGVVDIALRVFFNK